MVAAPSWVLCYILIFVHPSLPAGRFEFGKVVDSILSLIVLLLRCRVTFGCPLYPFSVDRIHTHS